MIGILEKLGINTTGYNGMSPEFGAPHWLWLALFALLGALVVWWAWSGSKLLDSRSRRFSLTVLRVVSVILLGVVLFDPALVLEQRNPLRPRLIVLWDASRSMTLAGDGGGATRMDQALKWWRDAASLRKKLADNYRAEMWLFSDSAALAEGAAMQNGPTSKPEGDRTDILGAIKKATGTGEAPAAILLISDGADNGTLGELADRKNGVKQALKDLPFPVFAAPVGKEDKGIDVGVEKIEAPEYGFVRNAIEIKVVIAARGFNGYDVPVTVLEGTRVISTKTVKITSGDGTESLDMAFTPDQTGDFLYTVEIPKYDGEAVYENNSRVFSIRVLRDKIRVLHVVGRPSWDERFLREALTKDPSVELISFYILREPMDAPMADTEDLSLIPFPVDELFDTKIRTFDLIIFQNFSWLQYLRNIMLLDNIRKFVTEFGGGFLMIGGPQSFGAGAYQDTPLESIMPVETPREGIAFQTGEYHPRVTEAGARHPITAIETTPEATRRMWDSFPPLEGWNIVGAAKTGATVLLEHPFQNSGGGAMPLLTVWNAGRGKVMALATDTSWRWNYFRAAEGQSAEPYQKFWRAAVRWLVGDPEGKKVRARTDKTHYSPGQTPKLMVKALDANYAPAPQATIEATLEGNNAPPRPLTGFQPEGDEYSLDLKNMAPGGWRVKVAASDKNGEKLGEDETVFVIEQEGREFSPPWPNHELLKQIADATGGQVWKNSGAINPDKLPQPKLWRVVGRKRMPLWDNWLAGGLLLVALAAEWFLRRRWGLN